MMRHQALCLEKSRCDLPAWVLVKEVHQDLQGRKVGLWWARTGLETRPTALTRPTVLTCPAGLVWRSALVVTSALRLGQFGWPDCPGGRRRRRARRFQPVRWGRCGCGSTRSSWSGAGVRRRAKPWEGSPGPSTPHLPKTATTTCRSVARQSSPSSSPRRERSNEIPCEKTYYFEFPEIEASYRKRFIRLPTSSDGNARNSA